MRNAGKTDRVGVYPVLDRARTENSPHRIQGCFAAARPAFFLKNRFGPTNTTGLVIFRSKKNLPFTTPATIGLATFYFIFQLSLAGLYFRSLEVHVRS